MNEADRQAADARMIERGRDNMRKAIWSYINLLVPYPGLSAEQIDTATEEFIVGGLDALTKHLAKQVTA